MNPELAALVALIRTSWPAGEWTDAQIALWASDLEKRDARLSYMAIEHLRETTKFRPTLTEFIASYQMVRRNESGPSKALGTGTGVPHGPMFVGLKAVFGMERPKHDHRNGAEGCPLCSLHDMAAHKRDRVGYGPPQCARCAVLADVFAEAIQ